MSWYRFWKERTIIKRGQIKLIGTSPSFNFFEVKEYSIRIPNKEGIKIMQKPNCTCQYFSLWGIQEECSHIKACKKWLKGDEIKCQNNLEVGK